MNKNVMIDAISAIDQKYIIEYVQYETKLSILKSRRRKRNRGIFISAACLALVFSMLLVSLPLSFIVLGSKPVQEWGSQVIENVLFPLDKQPADPDDPDDPTPPAQSLLQLNWIEWKFTEEFFNALGAGTDDSVIDKLQSMQSDGFVGESMQDLGDFLERLYEYYMKHKDEIDAIIGETETETEIETDIDSETEKGTETETEPETETAPGPEDTTDIDYDVIIDGSIVCTLSETGDYYIVTDYLEIVETIIIIPDTVNGIPIKEIGPEAFYRAENIFEVYLPLSIEKIDDYAFAYCKNLQKIELREGLTIIGQYAFSNCTSLTEVTIPDGVQIVSWGMFEYCSSLQMVHIPDSVKIINARAFCSCNNLKEIALPDTLERICSEAFRGSLDGVDLVIPGSVKTIEGNSFYSSLITSAYVPDGVTEIDGYAFGECLNLTSMSLPNSLQTIDVAGIYHAVNLKSIEFRGTMEEWNQIEIKTEAILSGTVIICTDGEIVIE